HYHTIPSNANTAASLAEITDQAAARRSRSYESLQEQHGRNYTVRSVTPNDTVIGPDVKVLLFAGTPDSLKAPALQRLQQYMAGGGSLLLMASGMALSPQGPFAFSRPVGWNDVLKPYGISIRSDMAYDLDRKSVV